MPSPQADQAATLVAVQQAVEVNGHARAVLTDQLVARVRAMVQAFTGWYDTGAVKGLGSQIAGTVTPTLQVMASQEDAHLAHVSTVLAGRTFAPVGPIQVDNLRAGVAPDAVYQRLAVQYRYERSTGTDDSDALTHVLTRADVMNQTDVALAARSQAEKFFTAHKIAGYRRVVHPELSKGGTCGLCIVASDRVYRSSHLMPIHARCCCGVMPIIGGFDAGNSLNNLDLGDLYTAAGSTKAADLKRTRFQVDEHGELGPVLAPKGSQDRYTP